MLVNRRNIRGCSNVYAECTASFKAVMWTTLEVKTVDPSKTSHRKLPSGSTSGIQNGKTAISN
ncbi:hypothetical protein T10_6894 [Trichinella papuae]|uniref:Uncharacterized protein n=1 Tax=Trichinella papuae TaxID=268474 RepID=A0A0V1MKA2_9BILA|nr:hypothetical protein T10_6894 [Trichinella papuae]